MNDIKTRYIYRITNLINGQTYIGQHTPTPNKVDNYFGSGYLLREAQRKYGIENFKKEILIEGLYSQDDINELERSAIKSERLSGKAEYNIANGGYSIDSELGKKAHQKWLDLYGENKYAEMSKISNSDENKAKRTKKVNEWYSTHESVWKGKHHTDETLKKMSEAAKKQNRSGSNNGSYGKHWYTNGSENIKCEACPEGFWPGRTCKN